MTPALWPACVRPVRLPEDLHMTNTPVNIDRDGPIATVTMTRPKAFNALNHALRSGLAEAVGQLETDTEIRVVILKGDGRGFCAGADLNEPPAGARPTHQMIEQEYRPILTGIAASSKIWIAQVHGAAAGIGAALAMNCDLVTIAEDASIYMAFAAIGLVPDGGNCWLLHRGMGYHRAMQAILEGRMISAEEARDLGLVNEVHSTNMLETKTLDMAQRIAGTAPLAATAAKRLMRQMDQMTYGDAISAEGIEQTALTQSADFAEGVAAFKDRRQAKFKGT